MPEDIADVDDLGEARALAIEGDGHHRAEQALFADFGERFAWEAALGVDRRGILFGDLGYFAGSRGKLIVAFTERSDARGRVSNRFNSSGHDRPLWLPIVKIILSPMSDRL